MCKSGHLSFSDSLIAILGTNESYAHLPFGTWTEGGCTLLALALAPLFGEDHTLTMVGRQMEDGNVLDHMVIRTPCGNFIDGNGFQSEDELLNTMRQEWGFSDVSFSYPDFEALEHEGLLYPPAEIKAFRRLLNEQLFIHVN